MIIVIIIIRIILILVLIIIMFIMKSYTHAQGLMSYHYFYIPVRGVPVTATSRASKNKTKQTEPHPKVPFRIQKRSVALRPSGRDARYTARRIAMLLFLGEQLQWQECNGLVDLCLLIQETEAFLTNPKG